MDAEVVIAGAGPVGLTAAIELGRRGVETVVIEPRERVSHARPRCKTVNVRTMEHLRRWGIASRLRARAPLSPEWSSEIVFCTSLTGHELSRFSGVLGLRSEGDRFPELGQQAPQYVLEELLREVARELAPVTLVTRARVTGVTQTDDEVRLTADDDSEIAAEYALGCDGARSVVREAIGSAYEGGIAPRPNFGITFEAPGLWKLIRHGPAVHYWIVNAEAPGLMGPLDTRGTWWAMAIGIDRETGERDPCRLIDGLAGVPVDARVLSTDPWTARMQLVDRARRGRVFLAGDAAHLNPPFGGHGMNTGFGDAVDLGWKLAAVLRGWGGPTLLESYESERRPVQKRVIEAAEKNNRTLATELLAPDLDVDSDAGTRARAAAARKIQASKHAEFHALDLVLGIPYDNSPVIASGGGRLPHRWLEDGRSLYDLLGPDFTLLAGEHQPAIDGLLAAARRRRVPMRVLRLPHQRGCVLVRPDQHVAWQGEAAPADPLALIDQVRGAA